LLAGPLATAAAIGFAVSLAQYVPVQLIGGGMVPTLTTEAVTLASGGSRQLLAAHAVALLILPALAFGTASLIARPRHA
jgi:putative thiamine transport system permease protein